MTIVLRIRWVLSLLVVNTACATADPPPAPDDSTLRELNAVLGMHGWPCGGVTRYERRQEGRFEATCRDGRTYEVYLRDDWAWRSVDRETGLHMLLDVGEQAERLNALDPAERARAAEALAALGPSAKAAVPTLTDALRDEDPRVRTSAARALAAIRGP